MNSGVLILAIITYTHKLTNARIIAYFGHHNPKKACREVS